MAPWHVVDADDKRAPRLDIISPLLTQVPFGDVPHSEIELPPRQQHDYQRRPLDSQSWIPRRFAIG